MNHYLIALALSIGAVSVRADERTPEQLLPPTTQAYARWDGIAAHQRAYDESARGKMFAGETGQAFDSFWSQVRRQLKLAQVGEPLLGGQAPEDLRQALGDLNALYGLPKLLARTGLVAGFEIRPPSYDLATLATLIRGSRSERAKLLQPQFLLTLVVPDGAGKPELLAGVRMVVKKSKTSHRERTIDGRQVTSLESDRDEPILAAWSEDRHFVITVGNLSVEKTVAKIKNAGPGVTGHPLYKQVRDFKEFRVVSRGFVDVANIVSSFEKAIKAYEPAGWPIIDAAGIPGIKSACFWDGFDGEESRGVIEIDIPGPRRGLTKVFKPTALKPADLPPLPADLTRFTAVRMDLKEVFELVALMVVLGDRTANNDKKTPPAEQFRQRKERLLQEIDAAVGIKLADLFAALGDKVVTYQAPSDGILNVGQALAVSVQDEKALRRGLDGLERALLAASRQGISVKKRDCLGVEVREFVVKENSPVTISYAICDGWLVFGFEPQPVRGFIHRAKGNLPAWKPDARTAATLAKVPAGRGLIQVADSRATLQWLYGAAPVVGGLVNRRNMEPIIEPGLFPHAGEASRHLFPNVMWSHDDGKVMRWESRDSLWLPLEFMGPEVFIVYFGALGAIFR